MEFFCRSFQKAVPKQNYEVIAAKIGTTINYKLVQELIKELHIFSGMNVLDMGCGCGGDAWLLSKITGACMIGIDRSKSMLLKATNFISVVRGDAIDSPLLSNTFDRIYAVNLLQLLKDRASFFKEVFRLLKMSGLVGFPITKHSQIKKRFLNRFFPKLADIECLRYPSISTLCSEIKTVGFKNIRIRPLDLGWFRVDSAYIERLSTGIFSGLLFLKKKERDKGLKDLKIAVKIWENMGGLPLVRWQRTLIIAQKIQKI